MIRILAILALAGFMVDTRPFPRLFGTCSGNGGQNTRCTACLGKTDKPCGNCGGSQQVWVKCPTCGGSGTVTAG